jgi:hypothetical protein
MGEHDPILQRATFDAAQAKLTARHGRRNHRRGRPNDVTVTSLAQAMPVPRFRLAQDALSVR